MPSPITAADFEHQSTSQSLCDQFRDKLLNNGKLKQLLDYLFDENGGLGPSLMGDLKAFFDPVGKVIWTPKALANPTPENGAQWLECNGAEISADTYPALEAFLWITFQQDDDGKIHLPDLQGRVLIGSGGDVGAALSSIGGAKEVSLTQAQLPAHRHTVTIPLYENNNTDAGSPAKGGPSFMVNKVYNSSYVGGAVDGDPPGEENAATGHSNMPPYMAGKFYILAGYKVAGELI
jgi:microcystin-dependent protein